MLILATTAAVPFLVKLAFVGLLVGLFALFIGGLLKAGKSEDEDTEMKHLMDEPPKPAFPRYYLSQRHISRVAYYRQDDEGAAALVFRDGEDMFSPVVLNLISEGLTEGFVKEITAIEAAALIAH